MRMVEFAWWTVVSSPQAAKSHYFYPPLLLHHVCTGSQERQTRPPPSTSHSSSALVLKSVMSPCPHQKEQNKASEATLSTGATSACVTWWTVRRRRGTWCWHSCGSWRRNAAKTSMRSSQIMTRQAFLNSSRYSNTWQVWRSIFIYRCHVFICCYVYHKLFQWHAFLIRNAIDQLMLLAGGSPWLKIKHNNYWHYFCC